MNWRSAVEEVAKYAPAVATALGGPAVGGAATGAALMVTSALGIENDPAALVAATQDPAKRAELVRLNNEHRQALEAMRLEAEKAAAAEQTARLTETQRTMRAELEHEGWFKSGWRGATGWTFSASCAGIMFSIVWGMFQPGADAAELLSNALVMFGIMAMVLGIDINRAGRERLASMGQRPDSFMDAIKARVRPTRN